MWVLQYWQPLTDLQLLLCEMSQITSEKQELSDVPGCPVPQPHLTEHVKDSEVVGALYL